MKLISCYIENFGNIKQRTFDFSEGLTSYCENNGYGKTTLAAFLKAMFYGLKQTRASDKELGERARFYPFGGGKFGGNVNFERDGVVYKIVRFFDEKSPTRDSVTVYANEEIIECEDAGKEFFGLDETSFLRTVFINSADTESGATGDISRMLNGVVDDANFERAKTILEKQQKKYRAAKGRGGLIDDKHEQIKTLKASIENKEKINGELTRKYEERKELSGKVSALEERVHSSRDRNLVLQQWSLYDSILADADAEREKKAKIEEKYPAGVPESEEVQQLKRRCEELNLANERHISAAFSLEKARRLEELSSRFEGGTPTEEEILSANESVAEIIRLEAEISNLENSANDVSAGKFAIIVPDSAEVKRVGEKLAALREKRANSPKKSVSKKLAIVFAILAVLALGAGAALIYIKQTFFGGVLLGVGGIFALAGIFAYFKGQISGMAAAVTSKDDSALENEIRSFLARYGYYTDGGVEVDYNNLVRDLESYNASKDGKEKNERLLEEKRAALAELKEGVKSLLKTYGLYGDNLQAELTRLGVLVAEYVALKAEKEEFSARSDASGAEVEEHARKVKEILEKYSLERDENAGALIAEIERDRAELDRLEESIKELERKASAYREDKGLGERPSGSEEDAHSIDTKLSEMRDRLGHLDREISDDEAAVERLAELKEELEGALEEEQELKQKYDLLVKTAELLERAEQNLKDRYIAPVKNSFLHYSDLLEKVLGEKVIFDKDFKVRFERGGESRSDEHLSSGQKSLCALCLRLALIDNMYKGESPFIIMDDPFVHLDETHIRRAKELLVELARNRQIIYFCCHESRRV